MSPCIHLLSSVFVHLSIYLSSFFSLHCPPICPSSFFSLHLSFYPLIFFSLHSIIHLLSSVYSSIIFLQSFFIHPYIFSLQSSIFIHLTTSMPSTVIICLYRSLHFKNDINNERGIVSFYCPLNKTDFVTTCLFDEMFLWATTSVYIFPYIFSWIFMYLLTISTCDPLYFGKSILVKWNSILFFQLCASKCHIRNNYSFSFPM